MSGIRDSIRRAKADLGGETSGRSDSTPFLTQTPQPPPPPSAAPPPSSSTRQVPAPTSAQHSTSSSTPRAAGSSAIFYSTPGYVQDLNDDPAAKAAWSSTVNSVVENNIAKKGAQFFNVANVPQDLYELLAPVKWRAFPKNQEDDDDGGWVGADVRGNQDEYCEWEVRRDEKGQLLDVTFTTETPEYYKHLSECGKKGDRLLRLYRELNPDANISYEDLFRGDRTYNPENKWNCRPKEGAADPSTLGSIAHMIRDNNTLKEAADLVGDCSILYPDDSGGYIADGAEILRGLEVSERSPNRNSDPLIAKVINEEAREGRHLAVANPVGLYIHSIETEKFRLITDSRGKHEPLTSVASWSQFWTVQRGQGSSSRVVRAKFQIPKQWVGKVRVNDRLLEYGSQIAAVLWIAVHVAVADTGPALPATTQPVYTFIEGRHIKPTLLPEQIVSKELRSEPFGNYLAETPPQDRAITLDKLLATFEDHTWVSYAADEGIGVKFNTPREKVRVRLVILHAPGYRSPPQGRRSKSKMASIKDFKLNAFKVPTVAVVAVPPSGDPNNYNSPKSILQCASFNPEVGMFNFYDRERGSNKQSRWLYFGNSNDAFAPDTQGLGPFCGHPNGGLVMKEFEEPWVHWHSQVISISLPRTHPMYLDPLWRNQKEGMWYFDGAEELADMINTGNEAWFRKRAFLDFGSTEEPSQVAQRVHQWIAHICLTTTITISSTRSPYGARNLRIPAGFFINSRALDATYEGFGELEAGIKPIPWATYETAKKVLALQTIQEFRQKPDGKDTVAGETEGQAAWKVVTTCPDDSNGIHRLLDASLLPRNIVLAMLMVDFFNPVFSHKRARLMRYIPSTVSLHDATSEEDRYHLGADLIEVITHAIPDNELDEKNSAEAEFLEYAKVSNLEQVAKDKIKTFVQNINTEIAKPEGLLGYMRVAETRRRLFRPPPRFQRPVHPLAEFDMSLPYAGKMGEGEMYFMKEDGTVEKAEPPAKIWHPRNTQAHFSAAGCPFSASF